MHRTWCASALLLAACAAQMTTGCGTSLRSNSASTPTGLQPLSQPATGPTFGYVWDANGQSLRPVKGVPGASLLGSAVLTAPSAGEKFIAVASSVRSGTALVLDASGNILQGSLSGGKLTQVATVPGANHLILSSSGAYALVTGVSASGGVIATAISGLQESATSRTLDVSSLTSIAGGAASDTGTMAVAGVTGSGASSGSQTGPVSVLGFAGQNPPALVATLQGLGGMQFLPNTDELIVADATSGALTAISHVSSSAISTPVPTTLAISAPVSLDISPDAHWVVVANHAGDVLRVDLTSAVAAMLVHCACVPDEVASMSGATFRLSASANGPVWIVAAGGAAPRVLFVPGIPSAAVASVITSGGKS